MTFTIPDSVVPIHLPFKGACHTCAYHGMSSVVYEGTFLEIIELYYDKQGTEHRTETTFTGYGCTQGHIWKKT